MLLQALHHFFVIHAEETDKLFQARIADGIHQHQQALINAFAVLPAGTEEIRYLIFPRLRSSEPGDGQLQRVIINRGLGIDLDDISLLEASDLGPDIPDHGIDDTGFILQRQLQIILTGLGHQLLFVFTEVMADYMGAILQILDKCHFCLLFIWL